MFKALIRMFDYSGRSTRWEYWSFSIGFMVLLVVVGAGLESYQSTHYGLDPQIDDGSAGGVALAFLALVAAPNIALRVRRYHDFGWTGWAALWTLVPLVNIFMEFMLLFRGPMVEHAYEARPERQNITIYNTPGTGTIEPLRSADSNVDQIARLAELRARGMLTAQEFATAKARILHQ